MRRSLLSLLAVPGRRTRSVAELPLLDHECPVCDYPFGVMPHACVGPSYAAIASIASASPVAS